MRYNQKERQEIIEGKTYFAAQARLDIAKHRLLKAVIKSLKLDKFISWLH